MTAPGINTRRDLCAFYQIEIDFCKSTFNSNATFQKENPSPLPRYFPLKVAELSNTTLERSDAYELLVRMH